MPAIPEISEHLQRLYECENLAFFDSVLRFKNHYALDQFNKICEANLSQKFDFSNREFIEQFDENTLR